MLFRRRDRKAGIPSRPTCWGQCPRGKGRIRDSPFGNRDSGGGGREPAQAGRPGDEGRGNCQNGSRRPGFLARGSWLVARRSWLVARGSPLVARRSWLVARGSPLVACRLWLAARGLLLRPRESPKILLTSSIGGRNISSCAASDERWAQAGRIRRRPWPPPRPTRERTMRKSVWCPPNYVPRINGVPRISMALAIASPIKVQVSCRAASTCAFAQARPASW
jgi:hypothetical protein